METPKSASPPDRGPGICREWECFTIPTSTDPSQSCVSERTVKAVGHSKQRDRSALISYICMVMFTRPLLILRINKLENKRETWQKKKKGKTKKQIGEITKTQKQNKSNKKQKNANPKNKKNGVVHLHWQIHGFPFFFLMFHSSKLFCFLFF